MKWARQQAGPIAYLSLLLALGMGLVALLASTLRVLLSARRVLHALCVIALAVLLSGSAVRLCSTVVKLGSSIVIMICHFVPLSSLPALEEGSARSAVLVCRLCVRKACDPRIASRDSAVGSRGRVRPRSLDAINALKDQAKRRGSTSGIGACVAEQPPQSSASRVSFQKLAATRS
jgi:hypothetical protein